MFSHLNCRLETLWVSLLLSLYVQVLYYVTLTYIENIIKQC